MASSRDRRSPGVFPSGGIFDREQPFDRLVMEGLMMDALTYVRAMPDRRDQVSREQLLNRVRAEFEEMPCLRLTRNQAQRLFGLRSDVCARVLETLVAQQALCREGEDRYRFYDQTERRSAERLRSQAS
jgi:hypothetical protein